MLQRLVTALQVLIASKDTFLLNFGLVFPLFHNFLVFYTGFHSYTPLDGVSSEVFILTKSKLTGICLSSTDNLRE